MIHRLAWHQLTSEKRRFFAALAGITFAVLLQLMQFGFRDALFTSSTLLHNQLQGDIVVTSAEYEYILAPGAFSRRRLYQALMLEEVEAVAALYMGLAPFKDAESRQARQIMILAFDPNDTVFDLPSVRENVGHIRIPDVALFDARSRPEFRPVVEGFRRDNGLVAEIAGRRVDIGGLFELGVSFTGNGHLITSDATFLRLFNRPEGIIEIGLVHLKPGSDPVRVREALAAALPGDVQVLTRQEFIAVEEDFWATNSPIGFIFNLGMFVGLLVGAVIVYQILYTDVTDHLAEYATLKAIGYTDRALSLVVLQEALILSVFGFPVGLILAQGLYMVARDATHLPMYITLSKVVIVFGLTVLMCGISGMLAMRKLKTADPAEAF